MSVDTGTVKKIVIIGLPNTGKSQVFYNLTREYTLVANYPLTTVEMKRKTCRVGEELYEVIDTPGLHCLYIHSEEELAVRDMLLTERPDVIIQCIDANRLKQSLLLTADLLQLGIPMVISLNAIDETARRGIWIDSGALSRLLGVPVVESVAVMGIGTEDLKGAITRARPGRWGVRYGQIIEDGTSLLEAKLPEDVILRRKLAVLLLLNDPFLPEYFRRRYGDQIVRELEEEVVKVTRRFRGNLSRVINDRRSRWVDNVVDEIVRKQRISLGKFSQSFARLSRHPVFGIPILLAVIFIVYLLVVNVANGIAGWMEETLWLPVEHRVNHFVPQGFWNDFLIGDYGVLSLGLANALLTVLPILSVFFVTFNILEDMGYIPNLCVLTRRVFEKIGLSGSAIMSLVLGFGCKTMATMTTKSLRSRKERYIAIYLIAFAIPCAAQMGLNMSILGRMGMRAFVIAFSVLVFVEIAAGMVLNKVLKEERKTDFIQELPAMRLPHPRAVLIKTYYRLYWFLKEALPVFIIAAVALFFIDKIGILDAVKDILKPVIEGLLGLPLQMVDALILCMVRHEAASGMIIRLIERGQLNYVQCIVAVTITTMFVPCFANIVAMFKELGAKSALPMVITINGTSFLIAGALNWALVLLFRL